MDTPKALPRTLLEAVRFFADPDVSLDFMVAIRWPNGVTCPTCGRTDARFLSTRRLWECKAKHPRKQFSVKVGTIFEDSPLGMDKWLPVVWLLTNCKNGISSYEVARALGVTQKTGWFMLQRVRTAMQIGSLEKISGEVEVDETYIGGKARFMHKDKRKLKIKGTGGMGKVAVMGLLARHGGPGHSTVKVKVVPNVRRKTLSPEVRQNVEGGSEVFTDTLKSYADLGAEYVHGVINHAEKYVEGKIHTNGMENFWSLLKRALKGTYVSVEPYHLFRYLDEQSFRFNSRKLTDGERFLVVTANTIGRRLTYKTLTATDTMGD